MGRGGARDLVRAVEVQPEQDRVERPAEVLVRVRVKVRVRG